MKRRTSEDYQVGDILYNPRFGNREVTVQSVKPHPGDVWADWIVADKGVYGCRMQLFEEGWYLRKDLR